jgi:predicted alpha-1,6-mannanase (GH76 family)
MGRVAGFIVVILLSRVAFAIDINAPATAPTTAPANYAAEAAEVTAAFQKTFFNSERSIYVNNARDRKPDYVWRQAAAFSVLVGAARHDPATYLPIMNRVFQSLDQYWDTKAPIHAYEPAPTKGNGNDKYYDDNAWLVITFMDAYELTHDPAYLKRATETADFVATGWDDQLDGGIWWHQLHKDGTKNTCANAPGAVGYLELARLGAKEESDKWLTAATKVERWTREKLQASDGLYEDRIVVATGEVKRGKLTYNSALMLRTELGLYRATGNDEYLDRARRIARAAARFIDPATGAYRDELRFSQFMVEADLDLYRTTGEAYLLRRAKSNGDAWYAKWKAGLFPDMMSNAGTARALWLLAETEERSTTAPATQN